MSIRTVYEKGDETDEPPVSVYRVSCFKNQRRSYLPLKKEEKINQGNTRPSDTCSINFSGSQTAKTGQMKVYLLIYERG